MTPSLPRERQEYAPARPAPFFHPQFTILHSTFYILHFTLPSPQKFPQISCPALVPRRFSQFGTKAGQRFALSSLHSPCRRATMQEKSKEKTHVRGQRSRQDLQAEKGRACAGAGRRFAALPPNGHGIHTGQERQRQIDPVERMRRAGRAGRGRDRRQRAQQQALFRRRLRRLPQHPGGVRVSGIQYFRRIYGGRERRPRPGIAGQRRQPRTGARHFGAGRIGRV